MVTGLITGCDDNRRGFQDCPKTTALNNHPPAFLLVPSSWRHQLRSCQTRCSQGRHAQTLKQDQIALFQGARNRMAQCFCIFNGLHVSWNISAIKTYKNDGIRHFIRAQTAISGAWFRQGCGGRWPLSAAVPARKVSAPSV